MSYVFAAEAIRKRYGPFQVLQAAGFWVEAGRTTALLGRNGCGKTTLVQIAVGWRRGDGGVVIIDGHRYTRPSLARLARQGVFYLSQDSWISPAHPVQLHFDALQHHFPDADTVAAIDRLEIGAFLDRHSYHLSGGERRRVELALAFARRPACLIADEPFLGLAPKDAERIAAALHDLMHHGSGILVTGHEVDTLLDVSDSVIWLTGGSTHHLGDVATAMKHHQFVQEYFGGRVVNRSGDRGAV